MLGSLLSLLLNARAGTAKRSDCSGPTRVGARVRERRRAASDLKTAQIRSRQLARIIRHLGSQVAACRTGICSYDSLGGKLTLASKRMSMTGNARAFRS